MAVFSASGQSVGSRYDGLVLEDVVTIDLVRSTPAERSDVNFVSAKPRPANICHLDPRAPNFDPPVSLTVSTVGNTAVVNTSTTTTGPQPVSAAAVHMW